MTLIKCHKCGKEVSPEAICCKHCGCRLPDTKSESKRPKSREQQQKESDERLRAHFRFDFAEQRKHFLAGALIVVTLVIVAISMVAIVDWLSPVPKELWKTAPELYAEYEKNPIAADEKYKGKTILVGGYIDGINRELLGSIYVALDAGRILGGVQCFFSEWHKDEVTQLSKGQKVVIKGKCAGRTLGYVLVKGCSVSSMTDKLNQQRSSRE